MRIALICALALSAAAPAGVFAAGLDDDAGPAVTVRYGDLDLNRTHDAKVLLERITDASTQACGATIHSDPLQWSTVWRSPCRFETEAKTVAAVNAPTLNAVYRSRRDMTVALLGSAH
ncbi:MAG: UrcA family protein [Caulobacteraceae bacterium]|nr:UrcA family protein [Caulobacteraceae bacterium]